MPGHSKWEERQQHSVLLNFLIPFKKAETLRGGVEPPRGKCLTGFPGLRLTGLDYLSKKVS